MRGTYVDSSFLVAIAFDEPSSTEMAESLAAFDELFSANLLEAELRAALVREEVAIAPVMLDSISWIIPDRPLSREIGQVLAAGYLRGADLWHVACALFLAPTPGELTFLTLDQRQRDVAEALGFQLE